MDFAGKFFLVIGLQICEIVATERLFLLAQVHQSVLGSDGDHKIIKSQFSSQPYSETYKSSENLIRYAKTQDAKFIEEPGFWLNVGTQA